MDQERGRGHHVITREAVHELFTSGRADADGRIDGMTEDEYFRRLDQAQEDADRAIEHNLGWGHGGNPMGPTTRPHWMDEESQRDHAMADPHHSGEWNLRTDRDFVVDQAEAAYEAGVQGGEMSMDGQVRVQQSDEAMTHLGRAAHALEDSYSEAHMWRGDAVYGGDPTAPVQSINVFDPTGLAPFSPGVGLGVEGTHDPAFDKVPVDDQGHPVRNTDWAAVHATAELLERYEDELHKAPDDAQARHDFHQTVDPFFQSAGDVAVNDSWNSAWRQEDRRRHQMENSPDHQSHSDPNADRHFDPELGGTHLEYQDSPDTSSSAGGEAVV